jgi:hypothetical protein
MRCRSLVATTAALALAFPAAAQAPASPAAAAPAASASVDADEPSLQERRIVAFVASGVAAASLVTGVTMGVLAQQQFACADDIIACNGTLQNKVVGEEFFDLRAEIEQKALFADMAFLFAGAATVVATVGFLRGFVFVDEPAGAPVAALLPVLPGPTSTAPDAAAAATTTTMLTTTTALTTTGVAR